MIETLWEEVTDPDEMILKGTRVRAEAESRGVAREWTLKQNREAQEILDLRVEGNHVYRDADFEPDPFVGMRVENMSLEYLMNLRVGTILYDDTILWLREPHGWEPLLRPEVGCMVTHKLQRFAWDTSRPLEIFRLPPGGTA